MYEMNFNSQWGQDKLLNEKYFHNKTGGFFVDVGAHDGITINNTLFYEKNLGWKGIAIEPIPEIYQKLVKNRKCICIKGGAYDVNKLESFTKIDGYSEMLSGITSDYNPKHLQRIDKEMKELGGKKKEISVQLYRLEDVFNTYKVKEVDYLSIDTEGSELKVLKGINFKKVKIHIIEVEANYREDTKPISDLLLSEGFQYEGSIGGDLIFKNRNFQSVFSKESKSIFSLDGINVLSKDT